jgi:hypothetical protein
MGMSRQANGCKMKLTLFYDSSGTAVCASNTIDYFLDYYCKNGA